MKKAAPAAKKSKPGKANAAALQVVKNDGQDVEMGKQLTAQYERAIGGMKEVVVFGAMMMKLREMHPELAEKGRPKKMSTCEHLSPDAPLPLGKWLEKFAPSVKRPSAVRFLHVTESIAEEYATIVGAKTAKQFSLPDLVTTPAKDLPQAAASKQLTLFDFISGTSQRSWLDRFAPAKSGGGNNRTQPTVIKPKTPEELAADAKEEITNIMNGLDAWFSAAHHTRVDPSTRKTADAVLEEARKKLSAVKS